MPDLGLAQRIRQVRGQLGVTQAQFAQRLGTIQVSVARYEAGRVPRADLLVRIAKMGNVTVEWLLHGSGGGLILPRTRTDAAGAPRSRRQSDSESLESLASQLNPDRLTGLPQEYRRRYRRRIRELIKRLRRELDEYAKVLEAEYRGELRRRRRR
jgi:transcriptional regulator with XRE-family HTH domain